MFISSILRTFFLISFFSLPAIAAQNAVGTVVQLEGKATILRGESQLAATIGSDIMALDVVETDHAGIAEIRFKDQSVMTVGKGSKLTIDHFVYNPNALASNQSALRISKGFFHFVSGKLAREKVKLKSPVSTIGIRGTELAAEVKDDGATLVSLVECCVDVTNESGSSSLNRAGTFSEVSSQREAPTDAALTPDWWAQNATAALGKSLDELALLPLDEPAAQYQQRPTPNEDANDKSLFELGPQNRKSFPYINR